MSLLGAQAELLPQRRDGRGSPGSRASSSRWRARSTRAPTRSSATSSPSACSGCRAGSRMDFTFTEEQQMMAAAFRELATEICRPLGAACGVRRPRSAQRGALEPPCGAGAVWRPGRRRSTGAWVWSDADFVLLAEEAGRAALPEPLIEQAALAVPALRGAGRRAAASRRCCPNWPAARRASRWRTRRIRTPTAPPGLTHWLLCETDSRDAGRGRRRQRGAGPTRSMLRGTLCCPVARRGSGAPGARGDRRRAWARGCSTAAPASVPPSASASRSACSALAVDYAKERTQFGQAIGSYQAIKHHLASAQVKLEFARPVVYAAVTRVAQTGRARRRGGLACEACRHGRRGPCRAHRDPGARGDGILLGSRSALLHEARLGTQRRLGRSQLSRPPCSSSWCAAEVFALGPDQTFERTA